MPKVTSLTPLDRFPGWRRLNSAVQIMLRRSAQGVRVSRGSIMQAGGSLLHGFSVGP